MAGAAEPASFCDPLPRPTWAAIDRAPAGDAWFEVAELEPGIWAIYEPWQWQEVISWLIVGSESALLFDTGNGIGDIAAVVAGLTDRPVRVINSHSHYDHVGGNYQFGQILSPALPFSRRMAAGLPHAAVAEEVSPAALCRPLPGGMDRDSHRIRPYTITATLEDGQVLDLGDRRIEVLRTTGHTPDSVALLDRERGFLWSGDSFYEGTIWLFMPGTDLAAYRRSVHRLAALAPALTAVFPAHNTPRAAPERLVELAAGLGAVLAGQVAGEPLDAERIKFRFPGFGLLIGRAFLEGAGDRRPE